MLKQSNNNETLEANNTAVDNQILAGAALEAFESYYAEDVVMIEANGARREGKEANRQYEVAFFGSIEEFHGAKVVSSAASGDTSYSEWIFDFTPKGGKRTQLKQVAKRTWRDGQIVRERFYESNA